MNSYSLYANSQMKYYVNTHCQVMNLCIIYEFIDKLNTGNLE